MKRVCLTLSKYVIGIVAVSFLLCFSVRAQQPELEPVGAKAKENPAAVIPDPNPDVTSDSNPFDTYKFPTHRERFERYVKDTVGPFRLARTAAAAGLDQWRDSP